LPWLADVNVLLALCSGAHVHHVVAKHWLDGVDGAGEIVVCRVTQLGLLRLLSNRTVMGAQVLAPEVAWQMGLRLFEDDRFAFWGEAMELDKCLGELLAGRRVSASVWTDAYLAAFAKSAGIGLVSLDRGFVGFAGLRCLVLE
jgi:uncharacterized protein